MWEIKCGSPWDTIRQTVPTRSLIVRWQGLSQFLSGLVAPIDWIYRTQWKFIQSSHQTNYDALPIILCQDRWLSHQNWSLLEMNRSGKWRKSSCLIYNNADCSTKWSGLDLMRTGRGTQPPISKAHHTVYVIITRGIQRKQDRHVVWRNGWRHRKRGLMRLTTTLMITDWHRV